MVFLSYFSPGKVVASLLGRGVHYENLPMQYTISLEAVLTSTHNVCFGSNIRELGIPLQTPVFLYKSEV